MTKIVYEGLAGRSFRATLLLYLGTTSLVAVIVWGASFFANHSTVLFLTPLVAIIAVLSQYLSITRPQAADREETPSNEADDREVSNEEEIDRLLWAWGQGDQEALEQLIPLVGEDLRKVAQRLFSKEMEEHTLEPTVILNELYLRLAGRRSVPWKSRLQFLNFASRQMRSILIDYARQRQTRSSQGVRILLGELAPPEKSDLDLIALDNALRSLESLNKRQASIVEMRIFGGLSYMEIAEVLGLSGRTVRREGVRATRRFFEEILH